MSHICKCDATEVSTTTPESLNLDNLKRKLEDVTEYLDMSLYQIVSTKSNVAMLVDHINNIQNVPNDISPDETVSCFRHRVLNSGLMELLESLSAASRKIRIDVKNKLDDGPN